MKWIVLEEDFHQNDYIAIVAAPPQKRLNIENGKCSIFSSIDQAMSRARELRERYRINSIRIFQSEAA